MGRQLSQTPCGFCQGHVSQPLKLLFLLVAAPVHPCRAEISYNSTLHWIKIFNNFTPKVVHDVFLENNMVSNKQEQKTFKQQLIYTN